MQILQNKQQIKTFFLNTTISKFSLPNHFNFPRFRLINSTISIVIKNPSNQTSLQTTIHHCNSLIKVFTQNHRFLQSLLVFKKLLQVSPLAQLDLFLFPSLLKSCAFLPSMSYGFCLHGVLAKCGILNWIGAGKSLMLLYVNFGCLKDAYQVFAEMSFRGEDLFNSLVGNLGLNGFYWDVLVWFEKMIESGFVPNFSSLVHVIVACGELGCIEKGMFVHDIVVRNGFDSHVPIANSLISMNVKLGRLDLARSFFYNMRCRDIVSWNTLIKGYARIGDSVEVFELLYSMKKLENLVPNQVTFLALLLSCGQSTNLDFGMIIHRHLICTGLLSDHRLGTAVLDMYAKCNKIELARNIFEENLLHQSLVSWNSLIRGYLQNGYVGEAIYLFKQMRIKNLEPDSITFANVIPTYASLPTIRNAESVHSLILKKGIDMEEDVVLGTSMVDAYGKCLNTDAAMIFFSRIKNPNTATWNALIAGYNLDRLSYNKGMLLFREMLQTRVVFPDPVTMMILFQVCGKLGSLKQGNMIHGFCVSAGFSSSVTVENAMIDMYIRCGDVDSSERLFSSMSIKNIVTWNTLLHGYVSTRSFSTVITAFRKMLYENKQKPDSLTMIAVTQAASDVLAAHGVEIVHGIIFRLGLMHKTSVINSLIDSYAKNGLIEKSKFLFTEMGPLKDECSWNVMIGGYGMNGKGKDACELFSLMEKDGFKPDYITFTSLLSSCSHSGLIEEGYKYFNMMVTKYKTSPGLEHFTCIVDMLSRAGRLEEACELILFYQTFCDEHDLAKCNAGWGAILSACRVNFDMKLGKIAGQKLSNMAPENCGFHTLMSNLYASSERWNESVNVRRVFDDGKVVKKPGISLI